MFSVKFHGKDDGIHEMSVKFHKAFVDFHEKNDAHGMFSMKFHGEDDELHEMSVKLYNGDDVNGMFGMKFHG